MLYLPLSLNKVNIDGEIRHTKIRLLSKYLWLEKIGVPDLQATAGQSNCIQTLTAFCGISLHVIHITFQDQANTDQENQQRLAVGLKILLFFSSPFGVLMSTLR